MAATQLLTRSGGWPNSVFLTPDLKPFFAGTYFPPRDAMGRPGFPRVLQSLREAWALRRAEVRSQAETIAEAMREHLSASAEASGPPRSRGRPGHGSGRSPRASTPPGAASPAPPSSPRPPTCPSCSSAQRRARPRRATCWSPPSTAWRGAASTTRSRAASTATPPTTSGWCRTSRRCCTTTPRSLPSTRPRTGLAPDQGFARVARETLAFVLAEMTGPHGGFLSAIDAETDGHEGFYYTWTRDELEEALPAGEEAFLAGRAGLRRCAQLRAHALRAAPAAAACPRWRRRQGLSADAVLERLRRARAALLRARSERERPLVDDKVLADWNGLMIAGFAESARLLGDPSLLEPARRAADFVLEHLRPAGGPLRHVWREGQVADSRLPRRLRVPRARPAGPPRRHRGSPLAGRGGVARARAGRAARRRGGRLLRGGRGGRPALPRQARLRRRGGFGERDLGPEPAGARSPHRRGCLPRAGRGHPHRFRPRPGPDAAGPGDPGPGPRPPAGGRDRLPGRRTGSRARGRARRAAPSAPRRPR